MRDEREQNQAEGQEEQDQDHEDLSQLWIDLMMTRTSPQKGTKHT